MKTRIIIVLSALWTSFSATAQEWVGKLFSLDTIVEFKSEFKLKNPNMVKCRMDGSTFYFVEQQGFQVKENHYQAVIHTLSTDDYEQHEITLPLPEDRHNKERHAQNLWIYDFCLNGDYLLLTTQDELILYKRNHNQNYLVVSTIQHPNLFMGYLYKNKLNFFEEDHDRGFKWFQQDLGSDSATLVRELPYEAPHIVQIQPNRYIFHNQNSVFFLSTRYPRMEVYDLDGKPTDTIRFDLPLWKAFDDEYIQKTLSFPYGIERIYAVKDNLNDYSYPKVAIPLRGDILLLYTQFDTLTGKSALHYALRKENGTTSLHPRNNHEDSVYSAARFPFTLFQGGLDKGSATGDNLLVQLTYKTDIPWQNKRHSDYFNEINQYFATNEPVMAYKVMRFKTKEERPSVTLHATDGQTVQLDDLPSEKSLLVLHSGLECSGCTKAIHELMNQTEMAGIHIGQVYSQPINGLQAHELRNNLRQFLEKPFTVYYNTSNQFNDFSPIIPLNESDFPCIVLFQRDGKFQLFRSSDLFTPVNSLTEFRPEFLERWQTFTTPERPSSTD